MAAVLPSQAALTRFTVRRPPRQLLIVRTVRSTRTVREDLDLALAHRQARRSRLGSSVSRPPAQSSWSCRRIRISAQVQSVLVRVIDARDKIQSSPDLKVEPLRFGAILAITQRLLVLPPEIQDPSLVTGNLSRRCVPIM